MSMELMVKAMKTKVGNPLRKLVLIKLADNASDNGECWPSYQHIAEQCEISRRSVINHISALEKAGLLKKIERKGGEKGNSSNLYILDFSGGESPALPSESPALGGESPALPPSESPAPRTSHSFEPVNEAIAPAASKRKKSKAFGLADLMNNNPHGIAEQVLSDWLQSRKASRAAVSETVWLGILRELAKCADAGISPESALIEAVMAGWRGFKFEWIQNRLSANNTRHAATNSYDCPKCGSHMDDCVCWAETINEGPF